MLILRIFCAAMVDGAGYGTAAGEYWTSGLDSTMADVFVVRSGMMYASDSRRVEVHDFESRL